MLVEYCRTRGYSVLAPVDDGSGYRARFQLDAAGNALAVLALEDLERRGVVNNAMVTVTGTPAYFYSASGVYTQLYFWHGLDFVQPLPSGARPAYLLGTVLYSSRLACRHVVNGGAMVILISPSGRRGSKAFATIMAVRPPTQLRLPSDRRTGS